MTSLVVAIALIGQPPMLGGGGSDTSSSAGVLRINVGPHVQNSRFLLRQAMKKITINGDNNTVILNYYPHAGYNYYNKQKYRRPLFWRFRRNYPK